MNATDHTITTIREFIEHTASFINSKPNPNTFLLEHGRAWRAAKLPKKYKRMEMRQCFKNSAQLALERPELTYVEGLAWGVIPVEHAWCVNRDGVVVDPTWRDPEVCQYFGVAFTKKYLRRQLLKTGWYGMIFTYWNDFELVMGSHDFQQWKEERFYEATIKE